MDNIRRKYNPMVDLSKFTFNKKILWQITLNLHVVWEVVYPVPGIYADTY